MQEGGSENTEQVEILKNRMKELKREHEKDNEDRIIEMTIYKEKLVEEQELNSKLEQFKLQSQKRIMDYESEIEELRIRINKLQIRIKTLDEDVGLQQQRTGAVQNSLQAEIDIERGKTKKLIDDMLEKEISLKRKYEVELKDRDERHMGELDQIENKVRKVVEKKDGEIRMLREELEVKDSLCDKYEELLERQRRDLTDGY